MVILELIFTAIAIPFMAYGAYKFVEEYAGRKPSLREYLGFKPKPPSEKIRAELRKQWLSLAPGEKDIPGIEWEDEVYYETPK